MNIDTLINELTVAKEAGASRILISLFYEPTQLDIVQPIAKNEQGHAQAPVVLVHTQRSENPLIS